MAPDETVREVTEPAAADTAPATSPTDAAPAAPEARSGADSRDVDAGAVDAAPPSDDDRADHDDDGDDPAAGDEDGPDEPAAATGPGDGAPRRRRRRRRRGRRGVGRADATTGAAADAAGAATGAVENAAGDATPPATASIAAAAPARPARPPRPPRDGARPPRDGARSPREDSRPSRGSERPARGRRREGDRQPPREAPPPAAPPPPRGQPDFTPRTPRGGGLGDRDRDRGRGERRDRGPRPGTPPAPPAPLLPSVSHLAESVAVGEPLTAEEVAEMKEHLAFLREYKDALRIKLNAAEDLMVNGRRDPTDRGVCRHLIGKVDRGVIETAVGREPMKSNVAARSRMLAGAIRLTADVGVLLAYLETLAPQRSHAEAAQAFAEVVSRIDFESLSTTRLARLLQVLTETFRGQERIQVLFGLLDADAFRRAFDAAEHELPPEVAAIFAPLRAVHRRLRNEPDDGRETGLAEGLEQVMAVPDQVLRSFPEALRVRMLELALDPAIPVTLADRAAGVLLTSLAKSGRTFTRLAVRRAAQLLARHVDDRARATLEEVRRAAPGFHTAERWLAALDAQRVGRTARTASAPERGRLAPAFWLDGQKPVWLRTAPAAEADTVAREAELQATLALPAVAPVVEHGEEDGIPFVTLSASGNPWTLDDERPLDPASALALAAQAARILRALALAGIALPDAEPERFCVAGDRSATLTLVDLAGAQATTSQEAATTNLASATGLVRRLAPAVAPASYLAGLVAALDRAVLVVTPPPR